MTSSSKAVVFLHTPIKINAGAYDVLYCYPQANYISPLGVAYNVIRLGGSAISSEDANVYVVFPDNIAAIYYNNDGDAAADAAVAASLSGSIGFLDLTV